MRLPSVFFRFRRLVFWGLGGIFPFFLFAQVEKIAEGFQFVEGPLWKDGGLLFSDIPANTVYRWTPDSGVSVYYRPSGNSNGLALDRDGRLLLAQHGKRRVARLEPDGMETPLATHFGGKRLNSPNDLAVRSSDGSIFFTDPPYGITPNQSELGFSGIYRISPSGRLTLLDKSLYRPNGIALSPDESRLYVSDTEARILYLWDVRDSLLVNKRVFARMAAPGNADGMTVDPEGRVFATGPWGVWVFSSEGTPLDTIRVPGQTTNCTWGDADGRTLYITSGTAVYRMRYPDADSRTPVIPFPRLGFHLDPTYPNPFNGSTRVRFTLPVPGQVTLRVINLLGQILMEQKKILPEGLSEWRLDFSRHLTLGGGVYIVALDFEGAHRVQKVTYLP